MTVALVTGGAGFIGSHLVDRLLADGHTVRVVDNLSTGHRGNLAHHGDRPDLTLHELDLGRPDAPERLRPLLAGVDRVFHLAALADIVPSMQQPLHYHRANVDGTFHLLLAIKEATEAGELSLRRLCYAASSSCYGIPDATPTPETAEIRPQYPYALTKWVGEQQVLHFTEVYDIPGVSLRLFNVYGPRARTTGTYGAVFGVFLRQKLAGEPYTVVGDGTQTRDFTFVTDIVDGFVKASEAPAEQVVGRVMNLGSGGHQSVNRLVELLDGPFVHIPKRPGEPDITFADTGEAVARIGWSPQTSFEAGVATMLEHVEDFRDAPLWTPDSIEEATRDWFRYLGDGEGAA